MKRCLQTCWWLLGHLDAKVEPQVGQGIGEYLVLHPTARKWVITCYNPNYKWINPTKIPFITGYVNSLLLKMAIEIVDCPIENGGSFHSYVKLPEGRP